MRVLLVEGTGSNESSGNGRRHVRGFEVTPVRNPATALRTAFLERPKLIILDGDIGPGGCELCRHVRAITGAPVLVIPDHDPDGCARAAAALCTQAQDRDGSVDCWLEVLSDLFARVAESAPDPPVAIDHTTYSDGRLVIDVLTRSVRLSGRPVRLTHTEWRLLRCLVERRGRTVSRRRLLDDVWGAGHDPAGGCLYLYVSYLRKKLEQDPAEPQLIQTAWSEGYRFVPQLSADRPPAPAKSVSAPRHAGRRLAPRIA